MEDEPDKTEGEDTLVPISALQHMLYCPRQCALIHVQRQWAENRFTAEGRVLHERTDTGKSERRSGTRIGRNVALRSDELGVVGYADVVEMHERTHPYPVEYKRGRPKKHRADEVQLCAQAMCLEEMLSTTVPEGALFYGQNRRRRTVTFDETLRALTQRTASEVREMINDGRTPDPEYSPRKCGACSLEQTCQPKGPRGAGVVEQWLTKTINN